MEEGASAKNLSANYLCEIKRRTQNLYRESLERRNKAVRSQTCFLLCLSALYELMHAHIYALSTLFWILLLVLDKRSDLCFGTYIVT